MRRAVPDRRTAQPRPVITRSGREFDAFWTTGLVRKRLISPPEGESRRGADDRRSRQGERVVSKAGHHSVSALHKLWVQLENEHHELEGTMRQPGIGKAALTQLRDRQARLLLEISAVVAQIRDAPAATLEDYAALLDVAIEHEIDLAADIAYYGAADFPMITRLLRALAERVPDFEFNSLRRWLDSPGQYAEVIGGQLYATTRVGKA